MLVKSIFFDSEGIGELRHMFNDKKLESVACPRIERFASLYRAPRSELRIFAETQVKQRKEVHKLVDGLFALATIEGITAYNAGVYEVFQDIGEVATALNSCLALSLLK